MPRDLAKPTKGAKDVGGGEARKLSPSAHLDTAINDTIGRRLQAHYRALADEPLPSRFMVLLAELEAKEQKNGS